MHQYEPVEDLDPVDGYTLMYFEDKWPGDPPQTVYCAVRENESRCLHVSQYSFEPTQERFAYLVSVDFASWEVNGIRAPWNNDALDHAIAA